MWCLCVCVCVGVHKVQVFEEARGIRFHEAGITGVVSHVFLTTMVSL